MVATAIYSVTMVLWKETAFPLCRAMERRWKRNVVVIIIILLLLLIVHGPRESDCQTAHCISIGLFVVARLARVLNVKGKGKVFPYSLPSVGPGADPGVQAVSPQVT